MDWVKSLDKVEGLYITPLRTANAPIIPSLCLNQFIKEVFGNYEKFSATTTTSSLNSVKSRRGNIPSLISPPSPLLSSPSPGSLGKCIWSTYPITSMRNGKLSVRWM
ncbi:hypothetical protein K443DRAFT_686595 [Laccaria amethystina LaAM-08-1]|uniref:Uncharacterized protein n=1 Tax=Laccaria amethystina LaAM-08-1 TaxID=1095629 RepID=A0A0C9WH71_9AGAR|nr:hypothetical protein K443DRAFT_686595 [Laccaria amethystina LaAM-08-1]